MEATRKTEKDLKKQRQEAPDQRIMLSSSHDGKHWSAAKCVIPGDIEKGLVRNCVGLYACESKMVLYCWTERATKETEASGVHRIEASSARVDSYTSKDGRKWELREEGIITAGKSHSMMFEAPRLTKEGILLAGGSHDGPVAYRWEASNPAGKPEIVKMPSPPKEASFPYGEATWYQTDEGLIVMFWRDEGASPHLYINFSEDGGKTWTPPMISDFPDSMSRVYAGSMPDRRFYLIGNSYPKLLDRMHLMISISEDGYEFSKMYSVLDDPTAQRTKGLLKCHGHQYPCASADKDSLIIGYSVNKEDIKCGIIDISHL